MSSKKQLEALTEIACKAGKTIDSFGDFDEESGVGHRVLLLQHGGLCLVIEDEDGEQANVEPFTDEAEAREAFAEIREEIENEQTE